MKQCTKCKEYKEEKDFYKNKNTKDGLRSYCKICEQKINNVNDKIRYSDPVNRAERSARLREYYVKNRELKRAYSKNYYAKNRDEVLKKLHDKKILL